MPDAPTAEELDRREGFRTGFLRSVETKLPRPVGSVADDLFRTADGGAVLDYEHFSLAMSRSRRMARWVAWNIDGTTRRPEGEVSRAGVDFRPDPRVPDTSQWLDDLYLKNLLDRGHVARRADLLWGRADEALRANADSFYFTNITPQMSGFNQSSRHGLWGRLENDLLTRATGRRISVLGGPVFHTDDLEYKGALIPREFWKLFVYVVRGRAKMKAFVLTQSLSGLELDPLEMPEWEPYVVSLAELSSRVGLVFDGYAAYPGATLEGTRFELAAEDRRPIRSLRSISW
jgi:endonuclease G